MSGAGSADLTASPAPTWAKSTREPACTSELAWSTEMTAGVTMATSAPEWPVRIWSRSEPTESNVKLMVRPLCVAKPGTAAITAGSVAPAANSDKLADPSGGESTGGVDASEATLLSSFEQAAGARDNQTANALQSERAGRFRAVDNVNMLCA